MTRRVLVCLVTSLHFCLSIVSLHHVLLLSMRSAHCRIVVDESECLDILHHHFQKNEHVCACTALVVHEYEMSCVYVHAHALRMSCRV